MRRVMGLACAVALLGACGSKKKQASGESTAAAGSSQPAATATPHVATTGDLVWDEPPRVANPGQKITNHHFDAPPAPPIADPDAVIARYKAECPQGPTSDTCKDLKWKVERILLDTIVGLRAANVPIDRMWWRVATNASLPQLACHGVSALARQEGRTPEEDAAILTALDHPAPSVRWAAATARLPAVDAAWQRAETGGQSLAGACIDGRVDRGYDLKWAGGYQNAKYRFFASSPKLRWFTTSDSVEKVTEFFTKAGRPPLTEAELQTQFTQKMTAEVTRITQQEGDAEKMNSEIQALALNFAVPKLQNVHDTGEIRYVMLTSNIGIAIFKDDVLKATSIVAIAPPPVVDMSPEALKRYEHARQVYGF